MNRPLLTSTIILALASVVRAATVITISGPLDAEGNSHNYYPVNLDGTISGGPSQRYQQLYASASFTGFTGPAWISEIAFRPDAFLGRPFSSVLLDVQVNLSTTPAGTDNLSLNFSGNTGTDDTVVYARGPLALSSHFSGPVAGPMAFDIVIAFSTPFLYDPLAGNLLLDIRNYGGGTTTVLDAQNTLGDGISRAHTNLDTLGFVTSPTGSNRDTTGLVTQFKLTPVTVPEPGMGLLLLAGGWLCFGGKRRRG